MAVIKIKQNEEWVKLNLANGGGISDAPKDGNQYARQDGTWTKVNNSIQYLDLSIFSSESGTLSDEDYQKVVKAYEDGVSTVLYNGVLYCSIFMYMDGGVMITPILQSTLEKPEDIILSNGFIVVNPDKTYTSKLGLLASFFELRRSGSGTKALTDNGQYIEFAPEAPADGKSYVRNNKEWVEAEDKTEKIDWTPFNIIVNKIISNNSKTISDEDYNTLKSFLKEPDKVYYPKVINISEGQDLTILATSYLFVLTSIDNIISGIISSKMLYTEQIVTINIDDTKNVSVISYSQALSTSHDGIDITVSSNITNKISLITSGTGSKALMDDGTYKEVSTGGGNGVYYLSKQLSDFLINTVLFNEIDLSDDTISKQFNRDTTFDLTNDINSIRQATIDGKPVYLKITERNSYTVNPVSVFSINDSTTSLSIITNSAYGVPVLLMASLNKDTPQNVKGILKTMVKTN